MNKFLNDELIAINLVALNDETNSVSEKLTLMNYIKKSFGQFDTTQNPKSFTGYEIVDKSNKFMDDLIPVRYNGESSLMSSERIDLMDVAPQQVVSVAASLIPFLEHAKARKTSCGYRV